MVGQDDSTSLFNNIKMERHMGLFDKALDKAKELKGQFDEAKANGTIDAVVDQAKTVVNQVREEGLDGPTAQQVKGMAKQGIEVVKEKFKPKN
jgi:hypothetical protein